MVKVAVIDEKTRIINELTSVTGIGEANAVKFIELGVTGVDDLRSKVFAGQIRLTHHMQIGLKYYNDFQQKIPHAEIGELDIILKSCVHQLYPDVLVEICGSYRRQKEFSGDIDVLLTKPSIETDDDLIRSPIRYLKEIVGALKGIGFIVDDLTSQGDTKYMGVCINSKNHVGRRIDIRFVTYESFYPALVYFTGSMMLNKLMRTIALQKNLTLNEFGLYLSKNEKVVIHSEMELFDVLGIIYLEPKDREIV